MVRRRHLLLSLLAAAPGCFSCLVFERPGIDWRADDTVVARATHVEGAVYEDRIHVIARSGARLRAWDVASVDSGGSQHWTECRSVHDGGPRPRRLVVLERLTEASFTGVVWTPERDRLEVFFEGRSAGTGSTEWTEPPHPAKAIAQVLLQAPLVPLALAADAALLPAYLVGFVAWLAGGSPMPF